MLSVTTTQSPNPPQPFQLKTLTIKNFQSIKNLVIEFEKNTAYQLKGKNDIGKSALIKAVDCLVNNIPAVHVKNYIRDNEDSLWIEAESYDGYAIGLSRGRENYYRLIRPDGSSQIFNKLENSVPPEISRIFNFYYDERIKELLNIRGTLDKLIMVTTSNAENYSVFQKALKTEEILTGMKTAQKEERELKDDIRTIESKIDDEKWMAEQIPDYQSTIEEFRGYEATIDSLSEELDLIETYLELEEEVSILEKATLPKELLDYDREPYIEKMENLRDIVSMQDALALIENLTLSAQSEKELLTAYETLAPLITELKTIEESLTDLITLETLEASIASSERFIASAEGLIQEWVSLKQYADDYALLSQCVTEFDQAMLLAAETKNSETVLKSTEDTYNTFMKENRFCPVVAKTNTCPFSVSVSNSCGS